MQTPIKSVVGRSKGRSDDQNQRSERKQISKTGKSASSELDDVTVTAKVIAGGLSEANDADETSGELREGESVETIDEEP